MKILSGPWELQQGLVALMSLTWAPNKAPPVCGPRSILVWAVSYIGSVQPGLLHGLRTCVIVSPTTSLALNHSGCLSFLDQPWLDLGFLFLASSLVFPPSCTLALAYHLISTGSISGSYHCHHPSPSWILGGETLAWSVLCMPLAPSLLSLMEQLGLCCSPTDIIGPSLLLSQSFMT